MTFHTYKRKLKANFVLKLFGMAVKKKLNVGNQEYDEPKLSDK